MKRLSIVSVVIVVMVLCCYPQGSTSIRGTVTGPDGSVIPGATVTITNRSTNEQRTTTTDSNGRYSFTGIPVGRYRIFVGVSGFAGLERETDAGVGESKIVDLSFSVDVPRSVAADLVVVVTDEDDRRIPNATIGITIVETGERLFVHSDGSGEYRSEDHGPGKVVIDVAVSEYKPERKRTVLKSGKSKTVKFRLKRIAQARNEQ